MKNHNILNVIWWQAGRGNWDSGLLLQTFEKYPERFEQYNTKDEREFAGYDRAMVIVVGKPEIAPLRQYLETLKSGVVILTSDEDAYFDFRAAIPPHLEVWTQYYTHDRPEIKERVLLGPPNRIKDYKINKHLPKKYLWSFIGQVQNPFRQMCVDVLRTLPGGFLHIADAFGGQENGIEYQEYLDICCQSKYVVCPAGSMSVDSFRLYEAIECGAIPITDERAPRDPIDFNYWDDVYPEHGIITVSNWATLKKLSDLTPSIDQNEWWSEYKQELENKLLHAADRD